MDRDPSQQVIGLVHCGDSRLLWSETYTTDRSLWEIYKALGSRGADPDYLEFLKGVLRFLDAVNRGGWSKGYESANTESFSENSQAYGTRLKARRVRTTEIVRLLQAATKAEFRSPLSNVLFQYAFESQTYATGKKSDGRGNLILTAIVEHFQRKTGKPRWKQAGILLQMFGSRFQKDAYKSNGISLRKAVEARVRKFKQSNPDWLEAVDIMTDEFYHRVISNLS